jgi:hypothetical protein
VDSVLACTMSGTARGPPTPSWLHPSPQFLVVLEKPNRISFTCAFTFTPLQRELEFANGCLGSPDPVGCAAVLNGVMTNGLGSATQTLASSFSDILGAVTQALARTPTDRLGLLAGVRGPGRWVVGAEISQLW